MAIGTPANRVGRLRLDAFSLRGGLLDMAAPNLHHVRQLIGADLVQQVNQITIELTSTTDDLIAWVDNELLRGIPARGGVITDSYIPGSDEHMDHLDNIRRIA